MKLADEHLAEFQMLYKKHFDVNISKAEALEKGIRLIRLMEITLKHEAKRQATQATPEPITK